MGDETAIGMWLILPTQIENVLCVAVQGLETQDAPPACVTSPSPNEQGHVNAFADINNDTGEHLMDYPPPTYTDLDVLRRDYDNGVPEAITYMEGLQEYSDMCLQEVMEEER
jgi:hypothetical protein